MIQILEKNKYLTNMAERAFKKWCPYSVSMKKISRHMVEAETSAILFLLTNTVLYVSNYFGEVP